MHGQSKSPANSGVRSPCHGIPADARALLAGATFLGGILAGGAADRVIVGGPAWHALGAPAWAQYSRLADLVAYPVEGIGSGLLVIAAAASSHFDRAVTCAASVPLYLAVTFSVMGLLLTAKAAPIMGSRQRQTAVAQAKAVQVGLQPIRQAERGARANRRDNDVYDRETERRC